MVTSPPASTYLVGETITLSATTTDTDLTDMKFVLDPGLSEVVIGTDDTDPYSLPWVVEDL